MMTLQQALSWLGAAEMVGNGAVTVRRVHTDTRTLAAGDLFVALEGERFDAHDFLPQAREKGAVAAIAQRGLVAAGLPGLQVADSKLALGELAAGWRAQFALPLVAVTGSNGKTTVTQMVAAILRAWKPAHAFSTEGNLNNDIGVPLTLLRLRASDEVGVVELGMNHPGEIASLACMARPTVALVNNAQREHLEFMATVEAVARENGAVITSLAADGIAVFPSDDVYTPLWKSLAGARKVLTFAADGADASSADVTGTAHWEDGHWQVQARTPAGPVQFSLHIAGRHNVKNALAATACALAAGAPLEAVARGLSAFEPVKGRSRALTVTVHGHQVSVVDDTYNANPDSMQAAIHVLAELPAPRLLVMGDMGEVGDQGPQFHEEAGRLAREQGIDRLYTLGPQSAGAATSFGAGRHFHDIDVLNAAVLAALPVLGSVLVKGSRFMKMERVVQAISAQTQQLQPSKEEPHAA
ncbi:MAG: UDP-N-acetylmuramoyl-tripeptide--D-alanyl-D-alanine ligase [Polaromonas sp.]|nr:UDP-N-acetylmuramoyl-tripeptide--D-alanyl-D-alanine ligase [Polaromonas sp.]